MFLSVLGFFPWDLFLVAVPCGQSKCLLWFQFSWTCWDLFCVLSCGLSLKMFHVHLKQMCILLPWDERLCLYISQIHFIQGLVQCHNIFVDILFERSVHLWQWGIKIPYSHSSPIHCLIACYSISMFFSVLGFSFGVGF